MSKSILDATLCPDAEILQAYIDNDLPPDEYVEVLDHTNSCPHCQAYLAHATHVLAVLEEVGQEAVQQPPVEESYERFVKHAPPDLNLSGPQPDLQLESGESWRRRAAGQLSILPRPSVKSMAVVGVGIAATLLGLYVRNKRHAAGDRQPAAESPAAA